MKKVLKVIFFVFFLLQGVLANKADVRLFYEKSPDGGYDFFAENKFPIESWIRVSFKNVENLKFDKKLPFRGVVKKGVKKWLLFKARPADKKKRYGFRFSYRYGKGDPTKETDLDAVYYFPYKHGTKHKITQGYLGLKTHHGEYALDFAMDVGTKVVAARDGIVVEVKEDSDIGGPSEKYNKYGNYILLYHSDGTFSNYVHLKKNGALVDTGDVVYGGDVIGLSGNTGRSSGPHLHFSVSKPYYNGGRKTIPVKFLSQKGDKINPLPGKYYYSTHYGKRSYKVMLGKDLTNQHYNRYRRKIEFTGKVEFRSKKVDDTVVIFFKNGMKKKLSIVVDFRLDNLKASRKLPLSKEVKPVSEVFICLLRPVNPEEGYSFSSNCKYRIIK